MHISVLGQVDIGGKIELQQPKKSSTGAIAVLLALVGLLLVLSAIAVAFFVINPHSGHIVPLSETATSIAHATGTSAIPATAIVGFASGTPSAGQPTHTPGTGTPHSSKTPTPTTSPNAPVLVVTPQSFTLSVCAENKVTFSVVNSGGSALKWTASSGYTLDHSQGVVAPGSSDSVTASKILQSGTVTISATDIDGNPLSSSPQSVTVTCKL
jgi:hypothetical protein